VMSWLTHQTIADRVYRFSEPLELLESRWELQGVHSYLILGEDRAGLIDSGCGIVDLAAAVRDLTDLPLTLLNTHAHWDHAGANYQFEERRIHRREREQVNQPQEIDLEPAVIPAVWKMTGYSGRVSAGGLQYRPAPATAILEDGQEIDLGGRVIRVIHTPGHSPGHCSFLLTTESQSDGILFTGDTAYQGPVFACFSGADPAALRASVWKLAFLENVRLICPGHQDLIKDARWLESFAEGVTAAVGGHLPGRDRAQFVDGREYRLRDFSLWLPPV